MKLIGYQQSMDGGTEWIVENTWGADWGEDGYAKIIGGRGDTGIELFSLAPTAIPYSMYDYMSIQNMANAAQEAQTSTDEEAPIEEEETVEATEA